MKRRDALKSLAALPFAHLVYASPPKRPRVTHFGAIPHLSSRRHFHRAYGDFKGISRGKRTLLWKYYELATGEELHPHSQSRHPDGSPGEGDCVGHATALGADLLTATDIYMKYDKERWVAKASVEMIYAGSRVEIGKGQLEGGAGSIGEWAAQYVQQYGVLHRTMYQEGDNFINLTGYHPARSRRYRDAGVPDWLEPIAKKHPIKDFAKVRDYRDVCDAIYLGQPVVICSNYAIDDVRDSEGFAKPITGRWREKWYHAWLAVGFNDGRRPGACIISSWLDWNSGPLVMGQPVGSFWADASTVDLMLGPWDDSHALSNYVGHPRQKFDNHQLY